MDEKYYKNSNAIHMRNYVYNFHFHLVWVTKYRRKIFTDKYLINAMKKTILYLAHKHEITVEKMKVMPDHIHLLLSFKPKLSATNVVRCLKGNSARLLLYHYPDIRKKYHLHNHMWSHSYYMGTVGNMSRKTISKYIAEQYSRSNFTPR